MRLKDERPRRKMTVLHRLLKAYPDKLTFNFTIVTEKTIRIIEEKRR